MKYLKFVPLLFILAILAAFNFTPQPRPKEIQEVWDELHTIRKETANDLVIKMQRLGVSFFEKTCIDIGTRTGENAVAMQKAGASVIGIDPDDREFASAMEIGLKQEQLHKLTLQVYHELNPNNQFDIATVILWDIPFEERDSFMKALANVIKRDGVVVIGYAIGDAHLYKDNPIFNLPDLMTCYFYSVERFEFPLDDRNRYMIMCRSPKT